MSGFKVKALYDFRTEIEGELPFAVNDVLTVTNVDVGSGWWEACDALGCTGLVPLSYFEVKLYFAWTMSPKAVYAGHDNNYGEARMLAFKTCVSPISQPLWTKKNLAQPSWVIFTSTTAAAVNAPTSQLPAKRPLPWIPPSARPMVSLSGRPIPPVKPPGLSAAICQKRILGMPATEEADDDSEDDDWNDECDDDDEYYDDDDFERGLSAFDSDTGSKSGSSHGGRHNASDSDDAKKNNSATSKQLSRIVHFTKGGGDAYLFDMNSPNLPSSVAKIMIVDTSDGPSWTHGVEPYACNITSPKKESKFHGMKSFIVYQLTPTFSCIQVSRRYKHFDWLQQQLVEKFSTIAIPPLPEKQISGRFEDDFINSRLRQLQLWIDRMCNHPVIAQSEVFVHFLSCTEDKKWKTGKRRAEKDKYKGGLFFHTIEAPSVSLDAISVESHMDNFGRFVKCMDDSIRHLCNVSENTMKKRRAFKKEFQKLGGSITALSKSFDCDDRPVAHALNRAIADVGKTYIEVGKLLEEQTNRDTLCLLEGLNEYKGLLSTFPDILLVHRASTNKIQESAGKFSESEIEMVQSRADVITYTVLAEMNHFQTHRVGDFKNYMQTFLSGQIQFYHEVTRRLQESLSQINSA